MKRNVRLMVLTLLALFLMPLVVNAEPLESFEENPIPYWENDSVDVDVSWSEAQQTVDFDLNPDEYWEDFSDVSDWAIQTGNTITTDGDLGSFHIDSDSTWDYYFTNSPNLANMLGYYVEYRFDANVSDAIMRVYGFAFDDHAGVAYALDGGVNLFPTVTFQTKKYYLSHNVAFESIRIHLRTATADTEVRFDYFRVWAYNGTLDVGVPLEPDSTQSIEFMGNFSTLNSTVRFEMYDNTTASGLFCDVNSTQVTFPDDAYAEFTDVARINFSLDAERIIFKIYVFAQNMTLINCYSDYVGLANNDYLKMNDSVFEGSYELWYLQGDLGYLEDIVMTDNIFYLLFLSTEMWGYIGPIALVIIGYFVFKKDRILGILFFVVECLFIANYIALVSVTPDYWWHIVILLFGGLFTCVFPLWDR